MLELDHEPSEDTSSDMMIVEKIMAGARFYARQAMRRRRRDVADSSPPIHKGL